MLVHTVQTVLDQHPGWVDVALDCKNAFNSILRRSFLRVVARQFPGLWDWAYTLYGAPTELYVRRDGAAPAVITSRCGTRQGCCVGAQFFCLGLHPLLLALQSIIGTRGVVVAYCDDIHILCPPEVAAEVVPLLVADFDSDIPPPPHPAPAQPLVHFSSAGLTLGRGKTSIYGACLSHDAPSTRAAAVAALAPCVAALGDLSLPSSRRAEAMLRGDGAAVAAGHPVLGTPVGSDDFIRDFVSAASARATRLIPILDRLLLSDGTGHGRFAPDERDALIRFCIWPRLRHLLRLLIPGTAADVFSAFDSAVTAARLAVVPSADASIHIDPAALSELPGRFGGHGMMPLVARPGRISHHDAAYYGSWASVWHYMRAWIVPLRGQQLAQAGGGRHIEAVQQAWGRLAAAHTALSLRGDLDDLLPPDISLPRLYSRLIDGRLSPASVALGLDAAGDEDGDHAGGDAEGVLYDLDACDVACHISGSRTASALVASHDFLALYDSPFTTPVGRARLLDGSSARGPFSFWRRVPVTERPEGAHASLFSFEEEPAAFPVALAIDLLLLPPVEGEGDVTVCTACGPHLPPAQRDIRPSDRHFTTCGHGVRLSGTCHDPAVHALVVCLDALFGPARVIAERPGGRTSLEQFMAGPGAGLRHRPDAVITGLDGPSSFTLIDVKTFDVCAQSHISSHHSDTRPSRSHPLCCGFPLRLL